MAVANLRRILRKLRNNTIDEHGGRYRVKQSILICLFLAESSGSNHAGDAEVGLAV